MDVDVLGYVLGGYSKCKRFKVAQTQAFVFCLGASCVQSIAYRFHEQSVNE